MDTIKLLLVALSALTVGCAGPDAIVEEAVEAAGRGDRQAYIACFTPRSRPLLQSLYGAAESAKPELARLGERGARITDVQYVGRGAASDQRALVTIKEGTESMPLILHASAGSWRIDLLDTERVLTSVESRF